MEPTAQSRRWRAAAHRARQTAKTVKRDDLPSRFEDLPVVEQERVRTAAMGMGRLAFSHCVAVVIAPPPGTGPGRFNNGTGFVLNFEGSYFLGTANHVVASWLRRTRDGERVLFQVGAADLPPVDRVVWQDETADIAFLRIDPSDVPRIGIQPYEPVLGWPPPAPKAGNFILFAGYPATTRILPDHESADFGCFSGLVSVTSAHDDHLICQFEREHWISHDGGPLPPMGVDLGGLSGAPAMLVTDIAYPLVGVVVEHGSEYELMRVSLLTGVPNLIWNDPVKSARW